MLTTPYLVFAALCVVTFGVAFASIGNLGILTRQRSLVLPLLLVFWCLPPIVFASERAKAETRRPHRRPRPRRRRSDRTPPAATPLPRALSPGVPPMTDGRTLGIDWTPGEVPALLGLTAIAIYGCVPETDQMPAIGVMLAGAVRHRTRHPPIVGAARARRRRRHRAVVGPLRGDRAGVGDRRRTVRVLAARARRDRVPLAGPRRSRGRSSGGSSG